MYSMNKQSQTPKDTFVTLTKPSHRPVLQSAAACMQLHPVHYPGTTLTTSGRQLSYELCPICNWRRSLFATHALRTWPQPHQIGQRTQTAAA
jgi:hypothetical protein